MKKSFFILVLMLAAVILCTAIIIFRPAKPLDNSSLPFEGTAQQQAAGFLQEQLSETIEQLLKDFPGDEEITQLAARFHNQLNRPYKAMALLEQGLKYHPKSFNLCNMMGDTAFKKGEYDKAVTYWTRALKITPREIKLHEKIADALILSGEYNEAATRLEVKIKLLSPSGRSYYLLGQAYFQLKEYEKAKQSYQKAKEFNPENIKIDLGLGRVYVRLKKPEKAKYFMDLYRAHKDDEIHQAQTGKATIFFDTSLVDLNASSQTLSKLCVEAYRRYESEKKPNAASQILRKCEDIFQKTIEIVPKNSNLCHDLAFLYIAIGSKADGDNVAKAVAALQRAIELNPESSYYKELLDGLKNKEKK
ncbi:MAG: tetratricopeptide repeat protein [Planctomycetes bacterium]|nr:tetratricopeptide repeat protein [Planctomycetota bacterium]